MGDNDITLETDDLARGSTELPDADQGAMSRSLRAYGRARSVVDRLGGSIDRRLTWWVLGGFLLARVFSAILIAWTAPSSGTLVVSGRHGTGPLGYWDMVHAWDGKWYEQIITQGYPQTLPLDQTGRVAQSTWAFLPLFPTLTAGVMTVTGLSFGAAGSLLSIACAAAAVVVMSVLLRERIGPRAAFGATLVFSFAPASPVLQMTYTESLGILLLTGFLWAITRQNWAAACLAALLLGFERPIALSMAGVLVAVLVRMAWRRRVVPVTRGHVVGAALTLAVTGLSGLAWPAVAAWRTGQPDAYLLTQAAWRAPGGVKPLKPWLTNFELVFGEGTGVVVVFVLVAVWFLIMVGPWSRGLGFVLRAWMVSYSLYLLAITDVWTSTYRFLLFLWPVTAVLIGAAQPRARDRLLVGWRTAAWVVVFAGWQIWWVWELLRFTPPADFAP